MRNFYQKHKVNLQNYSWRIIQIFGKQGFSALIFFVSARILSPTEFGEYNYILALIFLLTVFGDFGISSATSKFIAQAASKRSNELGVITFSATLAVFLSTTIISLFFILFGRQIFPDLYYKIIFALPILIFAPLVSLFDGINRGLRNFRVLSFASLSSGLLAILLVYPFVSALGVKGAFLVQSVLYLSQFVILIFFTQIFQFRVDIKVLRPIMGYSFVIGISSISYFLYSRFDIFILREFGYYDQISYYEIINKGFEMMFLPFALLAQVVAPNIVAYAEENDHSKVRSKLSKFIKLIIPASIVLAILFFAIFPVAIQIFLPEYFTEDMQTSILILSFLIPAKIWGVFQTQAFFVSLGYAKITSVTTLIGGILNIILDVIFIMMWGFIGVFVTTLVVHSSIILIQSIILRKRIINLS